MFRLSLASHRRNLLVAGGAAGSILVTSQFADQQSSTALEAPPLEAPTTSDNDNSINNSHDSKDKPSSADVIHRKCKPIPSRSEQLAQLHSGHEFDVIVIGGGATGAGAALDAASRGLRTALIERGDFGNETSARSTKLIWAGIRYIATAVSSLLRLRNVSRPVEAIQEFVSEFDMVLGAHRERRILVENNPHLVNWVPIAVPISSWVAWPPPFDHPLFATAPFTLPIVFKFYDSLSGFTCPPSHIMGRKRAIRKFPQLDEDAKYFSCFYEAQHNDARTNTYIALTAAQEGATVANYVEMIDLIRDDKTGKAVGVKCRDNLTQKEFDVYAKAIVFCGGPFTDEMRRIEDPNCKPAVAAAAGTHIVLPGYYSPAGIGMLDINTSDGRFLFFLPWEGSTLVGTTDRKCPASSDHGPPEEEIEWILNEVKTYLSDDVKVRRSDVLSAWQGWRPLASDPHAPPGTPVSRNHIISTNPESGVTFVTGGKWTTYREMAEDVIDKIVELHDLDAGPSKTAKMSLRGGEGYTRNVPIQLVQKFGVNWDTARHLARSYGMIAFDVCEMAEPTSKRWPRFGNILVEGYPYLDCEIAYACRHEMVMTVKDMLTLRTRLAYLNKDAALEIAPKVTELMAKELKWSRSESKRQLQEAVNLLKTFGGPIPNKETIEESFRSVRDVRALFRKFDQDDTGYVDFAEFKDVVKALGVPFSNDRAAMASFKKMDKDGDGKITENDFIAWWESSPFRDSLKYTLAKRYSLTPVKLGQGPGSRGAAFG